MTILQALAGELIQQLVSPSNLVDQSLPTVFEVCMCGWSGRILFSHWSYALSHFCQDTLRIQYFTNVIKIIFVKERVFVYALHWCFCVNGSDLEFGPLTRVAGVVRIHFFWGITNYSQVNPILYQDDDFFLQLRNMRCQKSLRQISQLPRSVPSSPASLFVSLNTISGPF